MCDAGLRPASHGVTGSWAAKSWLRVGPAWSWREKRAQAKLSSRGVQLASPAALAFDRVGQARHDDAGDAKGSRNVSYAISKEPESARTVRSFQRVGVSASASVRKATAPRVLQVLPRRSHTHGEPTRPRRGRPAADGGCVSRDERGGNRVWDLPDFRCVGRQCCPDPGLTLPRAPAMTRTTATFTADARTSRCGPGRSV